MPSTSAFPRIGTGRLLHYAFRGLLSVHSRYGLHPRQVAFCDPLHQRLQQSRCLHCCSDCYRVERTSSRAGLTPAVDHRLFTTHPVYALITHEPILWWHSLSRQLSVQPEPVFPECDDLCKNFAKSLYLPNAWRRISIGETASQGDQSCPAGRASYWLS
jgi:hypothetical protein